MPDRSKNTGVLGSAAQSKKETNADQSEARKAASDDKKMFNARIREQLYSDFQKVCEKEGVSMSWAVRQYMKWCVENGETGHLK